MSVLRLRWIALSMLAICLLVTGVSTRARARSNSDSGGRNFRIVKVPGEDRFTPFAITIRVGTAVVWENDDTDGHYVVSNHAFNTAGHRGTNAVLQPNGGKFGLIFNHPGVFPYYCRLHAMLDADHQPKAPGPDGGIQDENGNFGTPMNGVITVLEDN